MLSHKKKNKSKPIEIVTRMHPFLALQILPKFERELVLNVEKIVTPHPKTARPKYKWIQIF